MKRNCCLFGRWGRETVLALVWRFQHQLDLRKLLHTWRICSLWVPAAIAARTGGTLIEAIANAGGKLPERQVAIKVALPLLNALKQLHTTGIVHRDLKPEHLMIHNGALKVGDFGSAGCASVQAAVLASNLQKQAINAMHKHQLLAQQQHQQQHADGQAPAGDQLDQQLLVRELEQLQHQQLHLQADCTAEAAVKGSSAACAAQLEQQQHHGVPRFGVEADAIAGTLSPSVSGRLSVQAVKDAMNFRIGSIEYMAPEMLNKPTPAEVFHLVSRGLAGFGAGGRAFGSAAGWPTCA